MCAGILPVEYQSSAEGIWQSELVLADNRQEVIEKTGSAKTTLKTGTGSGKGTVKSK